jgi:hypothetical protein
LKDSIGAFEDIKAALNRFSDKPQIYLCRAYFWKDRNDYNKEMLDLLKVTELDSSNYIARENLACAKMLLGMYLYQNSYVMPHILRILVAWESSQN